MKKNDDELFQEVEATSRSGSMKTKKLFVDSFVPEKTMLGVKAEKG